MKPTHIAVIALICLQGCAETAPIPSRQSTESQSEIADVVPDNSQQKNGRTRLSAIRGLEPADAALSVSEINEPALSRIDFNGRWYEKAGAADMQGIAETNIDLAGIWTQEPARADREPCSPPSDEYIILYVNEYGEIEDRTEEYTCCGDIMVGPSYACGCADIDSYYTGITSSH